MFCPVDYCFFFFSLTFSLKILSCFFVVGFFLFVCFCVRVCFFNPVVKQDGDRNCESIRLIIPAGAPSLPGDLPTHAGLTGGKEQYQRKEHKVNL